MPARLQRILSCLRWSPRDLLAVSGIVTTVMAAGVSTDARAAEFLLKPSLTVSEEYTDNVFEDNSNKRADYITRTLPGLALQYKAPLWDWDVQYAFDNRYYARGSRSDDQTHELNATGLVKIVDEVLFLELSDVYRRVSLDVTRDTSNESLYLNQSDQNVGTVSPYVVLHPTTKTTIKTGYRYVDTWYKDPRGVDTRDHVGFFEGSYEISPKLFLTTNYTFTKEYARQGADFNQVSGNQSYAGQGFSRHTVSVGPRYEYADKSFIFAQGGVNISDYDSGQRTVDPMWNAGITHTFGSTVATISTAVTYTNDPLGLTSLQETDYFNFNLKHTLARGSFTLTASYSEFTNTNTDILADRRYSGGFTLEHELIQDLHASAGLTYEYYDYVQYESYPRTYTRKYFVDSSVTYAFGHDLSLGLNYKHIDYSSPQISTDNRLVNRVSLEVKKIF
jgi:uncharacterized protein (PEP-CTERM system associated)